MNIFQNHVYTVVHQNTNCTLGTYPNFKEAYERIEEYANGATIYDIDDGFECSRVNFEIIKWNPLSWGGGYFSVAKYTIYENLLTIFPEDIVVSTEMFGALEKAMKEEKKKNSKYKLKAEPM